MGLPCVRCPYTPSCKRCKPPQVCELTVQTCTKCPEAICVDLPHAGMTDLKPTFKLETPDDVPTEVSPSKFIAGRNAAIGGIIGGVFGLFILAAIIYRLAFWTPKGARKRMKPPDVDFQSVTQLGSSGSQSASSPGDLKTEQKMRIKRPRNPKSRRRRHHDSGIVPIMEETKNSSSSAEETMGGSKSPSRLLVPKSDYDFQQQNLMMNRFSNMQSGRRLEEVVDHGLTDDETITPSPALLQEDANYGEHKNFIKTLRKRTSSIFSHSFSEALTPRNRASFVDVETQEIRSSKVNRLFQKLLITRDSQNPPVPNLEDDNLSYFGHRRSVYSVAPKIPSLKLHQSNSLLPQFTASKLNITDDRTSSDRQKMGLDKNDFLPDTSVGEQNPTQQSEEDKNDQESLISEGALQYLRTHPSLTDIVNSSAMLTQKASLFLKKPTNIVQEPEHDEQTLMTAENYQHQEANYRNSEHYLPTGAYSQNTSDPQASTALRYAGTESTPKFSQVNRFNSIIGEKSLAGYADMLNKAGAPSAHTAHRSAAFETKRPVDIQRERMRKMISNREKLLQNEYDYSTTDKQTTSSEPWQDVTDLRLQSIRGTPVTDQAHSRRRFTSSGLDASWGGYSGMTATPPRPVTTHEGSLPSFTAPFAGRARAYSFEEQSTDPESNRASGTWSSIFNEQNTSDSDIEARYANAPNKSYRSSRASPSFRRSRHSWKQALEAHGSIQEEESTTEAQSYTPEPSPSQRTDYYEQQPRYQNYQQTLQPPPGLQSPTSLQSSPSLQSPPNLQPPSSLQPALQLHRTSIQRRGSVAVVDEMAVEGGSPNFARETRMEPEYPTRHEQEYQSPYGIPEVTEPQRQQEPQMEPETSTSQHSPIQGTEQYRTAPLNIMKRGKDK